MKAKTRLFGEIDIEDSKILKFTNGIIGFPDLKNFTLIYDADEQEGHAISWLQSMDEPEFAMPVLDPLVVKQDYNPMFSEESLAALGDIGSENGLLLVTVTVPAEIEKMSVNLRAPFVINTETCKAAQIIVEDQYPVKFYIYDILKEGAGE
ncbi:flagellar assembly protein FliW [Eubacterium oxidoreducens]|uniref:Flagellar assembly factor FliW n=1 Tax=Eubacterium oxidoreducens TaxID=1732 RepID=A0A1G6BRR7_EUBOX|nr:flagellar assembly protein FliW [Eubacterium oxidoreducens]SDB23329.1 flagellar assembly factor FliW [Eubacterium oxidoreducens]